MIKTTLPKPQPRHSLALALPFQLGWAVAAIIYILAGNTMNVGFLVLLMTVLWVPTAVELVTRTKLPTALHIHYHAFITASSVMGSTFGFYALVPNWDTWVHIDSGVLLAWLGLFAIRQAEDQVGVRLPGWLSVAMCYASPLAFAALWEISEFLSDRYLHTTTQAGLEDTIVDMIAAFVGATIAIAIVSLAVSPKSVLAKALRKQKA